MRRLVAVCGFALLTAAVPSTGAAGNDPVGRSEAAPPLLGELFGDHAVLQRDHPIAVWGWAEAGEAVEVRLAGSIVRTRADEDGAWRAVLSAMPAGGPYDLIVQVAESQAVARDILIGDVWLCSGQSNMVLQVNRALNSPREIANSADDSIRLMTIPTDNRLAPQDRFVRPVHWSAAGPDTVGDFSAACFFFAQDLRRDHDVPMGLITSAWGGSTIQAWMSQDAVRAQGTYEQELAILAQYPHDPQGAQAAWGAAWEAWWRERGGGEPWTEAADASGWTPVPAMTPWEQWGAPELADYDGMVWFATTVRLTADQARQAATLSLGSVDETDQTWVNGRPVGASGSGDRAYSLPEGALKAGDNTVVLNVLDTYAHGGLYGPADKRALILADGTMIPLDEAGWRYRRVGGEGWPPPPRAPWEALAGLTTISNAMIAPLEGYGFRGVLWYQGESNAARDPERYDRLLTGLMADWRTRFDHPDLPFLVVSLADHGPRPTAPGPSGWAELRDRTRTAVAADPHAGLAMAIDLGDRWDIHPAQKLELGRRLARAARHVVYGQDIAPSGPEVRDARRIGDAVLVAFDHVSGDLITYSGDTALSFELCGQGGADCRYVEARAQGDVVRLVVPPGVPAVEVRYAWADSPVVNLFDEAGLPAGPFRLEVR